MAVTVRSICTMALRKIRVLAASEAIETTDLTDLADEMRRMLDTWRLEPLIVLAKTIRSFSLDSSKNTFTYYSNVAADFNSARPVEIFAATLRDDSGRGWPLAPITAEEWSASSTRTIVTRPTAFWFNPAFPIAEVRLDAMPDEAWPTIELVVQDAFSVSTLEADWDDEIEFAPGYEDAIMFNLAARVADDYGVPLPRTVAMMAGGTKKIIKRANLEVPQLVTGFPVGREGVRGTYDINSGPVR